MGKKKQKNKQKQKQKQKKVTQRQQKRTQRKQEQKQKRQQTAQQKRAEHQRLFEAKQIERQKKQLKPKRRKKSENRQQLEKRFKELADKANGILDNFNREEIEYVFETDYGAMFDDEEIMTQSGKFRKNASALTISELNQRIKMLDSFITDSEEYKKDADTFENFADAVYESYNEYTGDEVKMTDEEKKEFERQLWRFLAFVDSIVQGHPDYSEIMEKSEKIGRERLKRGETVEEMKDAFYNAWMASTDTKDFVDRFSERGTLL